MAIDWTRLPDGPLKFRMIAVERQAQAVLDTGVTFDLAQGLLNQFSQISAEVRAFAHHLQELRLYDQVKNVLTALMQLLAVCEEVSYASVIKYLRDITPQDALN